MIRRYLLAVFCLLSFSHAALAEALPDSPIAKTELLVDAPDSIRRGASIEAGIAFTLPEHWHIYWKNPGDSGIPTRVEWQLPEGLTASDLAWPAPERLELQGVVNYGYSNRVILPVTLTPTRDGIGGEVRATVNWLVCKDICIPESATLSAPLRPNPAAGRDIAKTRSLLPQPFTGTASFEATHDVVTLTLTRDNPWGADAVRFSPLDEGIMANDPVPDFKQVGNELVLSMKRGTEPAPAEWHGVLHVRAQGQETTWDITARNRDPLPAAETPPPQANAAPAPVPAPLIAALLFAFLGGLILNIMPCVLPILALKALALSKKAAASRAEAARQGLIYTAGVVLSFVLIALVMLAIKAGGNAVGWGFQLQNPLFVGFLALVMLGVSANLLGLFELPVLLGGTASRVDEQRSGGTFFTGVLAVLVATPCTAPFMATAVGATLAMPPLQTLLVFVSLGAGMASPFLIISLWPAARRLLPKPGGWMVRFRQFLALPMLATAVWLLWVLSQILSPTPLPTTAGTVPYSATQLERLRSEGTPVLVDATAAWCITCKINERVALNPPEMQAFFRDKGVTLMVADWTSSDPEITRFLASFGRNGVPLYVYYPPHGAPVVLPQVLTPALVKAAISSHLP